MISPDKIVKLLLRKQFSKVVWIAWHVVVQWCIERERGGEGASEDDAWGLERRQDVLRRKGGQREKIACHGVWRIHYPVALDNSIRDDSQGVSLRFYRMPHAVIRWAWLAWAYVWVRFSFLKAKISMFCVLFFQYNLETIILVLWFSFYV